jgi:hypothetical protein
MTNSILIDIDTEREKIILFGKPPHIAPPETKEESKAMILNDIACLAESIKTLIIIASENQYGDINELTTATVKTIYDALTTDESNKK